MAIFAGDIPAALLRMPGTPSSAAYVEDAYRMTQSGRGDDALGAALVFSAIGGIGIVYLIGIPWLAMVAKLSLFDAAKGSLIFVPGDLIKAAVAAVIAETVRRSYPLMQAAR